MFDGDESGCHDEHSGQVVPTNTATSLTVTAKDLDGNDTAPGTGADEYTTMIDFESVQHFDLYDCFHSTKLFPVVDICSVGSPDSAESVNTTGTHSAS